MILICRHLTTLPRWLAKVFSVDWFWWCGFVAGVVQCELPSSHHSSSSSSEQDPPSSKVQGGAPSPSGSPPLSWNHRSSNPLPALFFSPTSVFHLRTSDLLPPLSLPTPRLLLLLFLPPQPLPLRRSRRDTERERRILSGGKAQMLTR